MCVSKLLVFLVFISGFLFSFNWREGYSIVSDKDGVGCQIETGVQPLDAQMLSILLQQTGSIPKIGTSFYPIYDQTGLYWKLMSSLSSSDYNGLLGVQLPVADYTTVRCGFLTQGQNIIPQIGIYSENDSFRWHLSYSGETELLVGVYKDIFSSVEDYFKLLTPTEGTVTNRDEIYVKGFYYDNGKIQLDGKTLNLRSDGLFIEKTRLPNIGENKIILSMTGERINDYHYSITVKRIYPFLDIPEVRQKEWVPLINILGFNKQDIFHPETEVSKKEFATSLAKLVNLKLVTTDTRELFTDVTDTDLHHILVSFVEYGILSPHKGDWNPDLPITKREAITIFSRIIPNQRNTNLPTYDDVPNTDWIYPAASLLTAYGILNKTKLEPDKPLIRADFWDLMAAAKPYISISLPPLSVTNIALTVPKQPSLQHKPIVPLEKQQPPIEDDTDKTQKAVKMIASILDIDHETGKNSNQNSPTTLTELNISDNMIIQTETYTITGKAAPNSIIKCNDHKVTTGKNGNFSIPLKLKTGINDITFTAGNESLKFRVNVLKHYKDIVSGDYFTPLIERILSLGYIDLNGSFLPAKPVTKKELYTALVRCGYLRSSEVEYLEQPQKQLSYEDAIKLFRDLCHISVSPSSTESVLTRKVFVLLLYELPHVKEAVRKTWAQ